MPHAAGIYIREAFPDIREAHIRRTVMFGVVPRHPAAHATRQPPPYMDIREVSENDAKMMDGIIRERF